MYFARSHYLSPPTFVVARIYRLIAPSRLDNLSNLMRKVSIGYYSEPVLFDKLLMLPIWEHQIIFEVDAARSYNLYLHIYSRFPLI